MKVSEYTKRYVPLKVIIGLVTRGTLMYVDAWVHKRGLCVHHDVRGDSGAKSHPADQQLIGVADIGKHWKISHVNTGLGLTRATYRTLRHAKYVCSVLASLHDWNTITQANIGEHLPLFKRARSITLLVQTYGDKWEIEYCRAKLLGEI